MGKEIHEQPRAVADTLLGRLLPDGTWSSTRSASPTTSSRRSTRCSSWRAESSYHAGMVAKYAIEHLARLPAEIDIAAEFRYRDPVLDERTLVIGVSQSGETVDTLQAMREARQWGAKILVISNVVDSSMAREADGVLYTRAGPEIGVAATKTHLAQIVALELLALYLAQLRGTLSRRRPDAVRRPWAGCPSWRWPWPRARRRRRRGGRRVHRDARLLLPRAPRRLPRGPRGRAQAEGDLLPAGRGLSRPASSSTGPSP